MDEQPLGGGLDPHPDGQPGIDGVQDLVARLLAADRGDEIGDERLAELAALEDDRVEPAVERSWMPASPKVSAAVRIPPAMR